MLALCALTVGGNVASVEGLWRRVLGVGLGAAMTVPLLARRRAPLAVMTAVVALHTRGVADVPDRVEAIRSAAGLRLT